MSRNEDVWDRIDVSDWQTAQTAYIGTNRQAWLVHPETGAFWLYKSIHVPSNEVPQGEDWAEVIATQVALLLGVPCAETRLCVRSGVRGSLSLSVIPDGFGLNDGGVVLETAEVPGYFRHTAERKACDPARPGVRRPGHTLVNIQHVLQDVTPPEGFQGPDGCVGFDVFAGFMILDALVANQDRHEENWAVLGALVKDVPDRLAPSFDHGGSLGYNLTDDKRCLLLDSDAALAAWAAKATAQRFEHVRPAKSLVEHAVEAAELAAPRAIRWWGCQLEMLDLTPLHDVLRGGQVPGMSEVAATFVSRLLECNLGRLRDAICSSS